VDLGEFCNKNIVITGGSGDQFASDIVKCFLNANAYISILTRSKERTLLKISENYDRELLDKIRIYEVDYFDEESLINATSLISKEKGIDVLINNAATAKIGDVSEVTLDEWNIVMHVNVTVPMLLSRLCYQSLKVSSCGAIVNISSIYGVNAPKHFIYGDSGLNSPLNYGVSKAALQHMTKYLGTYWSPEVRVNAVAPGGFFAGQPNAFVEQYVRYVPLGRMAEVGDVSGAVFFLSSRESKYITGQTLSVDGGWTCW
jgi:NAD(P)-dependent dehydrogenase (short-subunit alcohol dehydrogenase family)